MLENYLESDEGSFWERSGVGEERIDSLLHKISVILKSESDPHAAVNEAIALLQSYNAREVASVILYLEDVAEFFSKKLLSISDILSSDSASAIDSILSFTELFTEFEKLKDKDEEG